MAQTGLKADQPHVRRLSRRDFFKASAAFAAASAALAACGREASQDGSLQLIADPSISAPSPIEAQAATASSPTSAPAWLAANRLMFGPRAGDVARIEKMGMDAFIEEQLAPEQLDDGDVTRRISQIDHLQDTLTHSAAELASATKRDILLDLQQATLLRAVYSPRQLFELTVDFWSNHFNIYFGKGTDAYLKPVDDREVIRPHALGKFRDLAGASAHSPAMLIFLDNQSNVKGKPNENYSRELMELHTVGVDGGYTQKDVQEVARAFTGWSVRAVKKDVPADQQAQGAGEFLFRANQHDDDAKTVLGMQLPANGAQKDGERVLDILAAHPSCATFISLKLARRFVADDPPKDVVQLGAAAFTKSNGDLKATLGAILHSDAFKQSLGQKMKRPFELVASAVRGVGAETDGGKSILYTMREMGQPLFLWDAPNGYPDVQGAWLGAGTLLARWNFGMSLARNAIKGTRVDREAMTSTEMTLQLLGAPLPKSTQAVFQPFANDRLAYMALLINSPLFQVRG